MDNEQILETYLRGLSSSGKTRTLFEKYARDFITYADGDFSREKVNRYLEHMKKKGGYSDGSINFAFRVIRTVCSRNGIAWPFRRGESPQIREDRIQAPALHPNTISRMIAQIRAAGSKEAQTFLALSTTWGLRRVEMVQLDEHDVRLKDRVIHISTAKHGRERTHLIPEAIVPYLAQFDFSEKRSESYVYQLWYQVEHVIGMKHVDQVGWHSVRRSLNTILLRLLPEATVMSYLRWKQRTSSHMPFRYSAIKFVGEEGESTEVVGDALDVDNQVFKVHPFIEFWR